MSQRYRKTPSEMLSLTDPYTAYCFNEACACIMKHLDDKEEPVFEVRYSRASELYKNILSK